MKLKFAALFLIFFSEILAGKNLLHVLFKKKRNEKGYMILHAPDYEDSCSSSEINSDQRENDSLETVYTVESEPVDINYLDYLVPLMKKIDLDNEGYLQPIPQTSRFRSDSRISNWSESAFDLSKLSSGLEKYQKKLNQQQPSSIALELDMETYHPEKDAYSKIIDIIHKLCSSHIKIDEGQKSVGLLMLYLKNHEEYHKTKENLSYLRGITVKDGIEYTQTKALSLLVKKNKPYIYPEALVSLYVERELRLEEIALKMEKNPEEIEDLYKEVLKKRNNFQESVKPNKLSSSGSESDWDKEFFLEEEK